MDFNNIKEIFKNKGELTIHDGKDHVFQFIKLQHWHPAEEDILLIHEMFQLKGLVGNFSEVALDIIEFSPDKLIFHSPSMVKSINAPNSNGFIKFALIKHPFWNKLLFHLREVVVFRAMESSSWQVETQEIFPLLEGKIKEMQLNAEGGVKILKG
ncbi:MAG: hypothetical protein WD398_12355 [Cyclobacteriaceae bacterium]